MAPQRSDEEWRIVLLLLPDGWRAAARSRGAFLRPRGDLREPDDLLRLLLFHAVGESSLRSTVAEAEHAGLGRLSNVALLKRLRSSVAWLTWLSTGLATRTREQLPALQGYRPRAIDSTTVQAPASRGTSWRLHYTLDLLSLSCDWHELTDAHGSELLERAVVRRGDVLLGDRNFLRPAGVRAVLAAQAHVLVRLKWLHPAMVDERGKRISVLARARTSRVGQMCSWPAFLLDPQGPAGQLPGRFVTLKLPGPVAQRNRERLQKQARKKGKTPHPHSLEAAGYLLLWTTLPGDPFGAEQVLEWYRFRWQVEIAFKRLKQLLKLGRVPHQDEQGARGWIQAKVVVALLLETLYRNAAGIFPWGYEFARGRASEPVAVDAAGASLPPSSSGASVATTGVGGKNAFG